MCEDCKKLIIYLAYKRIINRWDFEKFTDIKLDSNEIKEMIENTEISR